MVSLHWVRTFDAIVEHGSFTRAADQLGLTQAAVSQHVRHLEERLGPLLIRRPRRLELTPAGEALLAYSRELDGAQRRLETRLADAEGATGAVRLITPGSVGLFLYPLLLTLQEENRDLTIHHRFAPDAEVLEAVLHNRFELGLLTAKPDDARLAVSAFTEEVLELIVPADEEIRGWADLQRIGMIDHPDGHAMAARLLARRFPNHPGLTSLPIRGFSNQIGLILEPVARGLGFAILPRHARQAFPRPDAIRVVEGESIVDKLWLIRRSEWPLSRRSMRVTDYLRVQLNLP